MQYNLMNRLVFKKPTVVLGEGKEYTINNSKNAVLLFNQKVKDLEKNDKAEDLYDTGIKMFLGDKALGDIKALDLPMKGYETIFSTIMAAIEEISLEEYEERERLKEGKPRGSKK